MARDNSARGLWNQVKPRAVNAEPWEPPRGMVKRRCTACWYWFAAPPSTSEKGAYCPQCWSEGVGRGHRAKPLQ